MNTSSDIWFAFARTFTVLLLVLALLVLGFYLIRRLSTARGIKGSKNFIKVLSVHHLSPKEKLVLVTVLGDTILIGVTPSNISKISSFEKELDFMDERKDEGFHFSQFLAKKMGRSSQDKGMDLFRKGKTNEKT